MTRSAPKRPAINAINWITSRHWAMEEQAIQTMLEIAARENLSPEAVAARLGRPLDNTHAVSVRDGIATIPVVGPMFRYADFFTEISGATTYDQLATDLTSALENRAIQSIVLATDSPGGDANGISELAAIIAQAREVKPIVAFVGGMGASAAYWLASAASAVVASNTALLGSIGVRMAYRDTSAIDQAKGVKTIEIISSQSPNKRMDPTEDIGRAALQQVVDDLASVFVDTVAAYRGVSPETVLADFGQGGVFVGQAAVTQGLADALGTYESTVAALRERGASAVAEWRGTPSARATSARVTTAARVAAPSPESAMADADKTQTPAAAATPPATEATITPAPAAAAAIDELAVRRAERERIASIHALGKGADQKLVQQCIEEGVSADAAARVFLEAQQQSAAAKLEQLRGDEKTVPTAAPSASGEPTAREAAKAATRAYYALSAPKKTT